MTGVLASEWVKIRSLRASCYILGVVIAAVLLAGFLVWRSVQGWEQVQAVQRVRLQPPAAEGIVLPVLQSCAAVFGVLVMTSEYVTGMIRTSLAAVPKRLTLLMSKAGVVAVTAFVVGLLIPTATYLLNRAIIGDRPLFLGHAMRTSELISTLLSLGLSTTVIALVGLGLGTVFRSAAAALVTITGLLFMLPVIAGYLPEPWSLRLMSLTLSNLPGQLASHPTSVGILAPHDAFLIMMAYPILALSAAAVLLAKLDA